MNERVRAIVKLIIVIAIIGITPFLFFRIIGDNPLKVATPKETATKTIAIINEDIGTEENDEELKLGQDVSAILSQNSNYEWTVVGRSAGENGLRDKKYDAIVYLPSDFTEKIMTYDEENPVKTNFQYKVQSQLNAVNKEKVLVELEKATKRVNQKISTLYWNYVSADMEQIRGEFDEILEKEVAFQQTMSAFYKPSSKDLAGHIEDQKAMLTNLQSITEQLDKQEPEQKATMEGYAQSLANFVKYVEQYKEYQEKQQKLLAEIQAKSIETVHNATQKQQPLFTESKNLFEENGSLFIEKMNTLETQMVGTEQLLSQLQQQRYSLVDKQVNEYYQHQEKIIDFYQQLKDSYLLDDLQGKLESLSDELSKVETPTEPETPAEPEKPTEPDPNDEKPGTETPEPPGNTDNPTNPGEEENPETPDNPENPETPDNPENPETPDNPENPETPDNPENPETPGNPEEPETPEEPEAPFIDLTKEKEELVALAAELTKIKTELSSLEQPTVEDITKSLAGFDAINERISNLQTSLSEKENGQKNPLEDEFNKLLNAYSELRKQYDLLENTLKHKDGYIKELETNIDGLKSDIDVLNGEIDELNKTIEELNKTIDSLEKEKAALIVENKKLETELNLYKDYEADIRDEINKKEQSILSSNVLSESRKEKISKIFGKDINSKDLVQMMFYYSYLDRYDATLKSMASVNQEKAMTLGNELLQQQANRIVQIAEDEQAKWNQLGTDMPTNQDVLNTMEDGFTVFMAEYSGKIDEHQKILLENLDGILQEATKVLDQINQPQQMLTIVEPTPAVEGQEVISDTERISNQMELIHTMMDSIKESQGTIVDYTGELQVRVNDVQVDADKLNNKWASNVASTELIRNDVFSVLGNTFVDGQSNGYVYDFLTNPLKISGDVPEETQTTTVKNLPPVVVLFIVLICSLLIGYTSYYFQQPPLWIQAILFVLLNIIIGLIISLFGLEIYPLRENSAVQWTVYTIFLLTAGSALVRVAFSVHHLVGLFVTVGMVIFYVTPLLALTTPNFIFEDPMSSVYMSIQYGSESQFGTAITVLSFMILCLGALQYFIGRASKVSMTEGSETYEA